MAYRQLPLWVQLTDSCAWCWRRLLQYSSRGQTPQGGSRWPYSVPGTFMRKTAGPVPPGMSARCLHVAYVLPGTVAAGYLGSVPGGWFLWEMWGWRLFGVCVCACMGTNVHHGQKTHVGVCCLLQPCGCKDWTQVIKLGGLYLYPLSRLTGPSHYFLRWDLSLNLKLTLFTGLAG